jgi:PTS system N-acetylglucosamine-specific IIC component
VRLDLKTPGRETEQAPLTQASAQDVQGADGWITALGGAGNLKGVDACTTRLRLQVINQDAVLETQLKALGARGLVRPGGDALQVVVGPLADQLAAQIKTRLRNASVEVPRAQVSTTAISPAGSSGEDYQGIVRTLLAALGDRSNIESLDAHSTRLRIQVLDASKVDETRMRALGLRGIARPAPNVLHLLVGPAASQMEGMLRRAATL